MILSLNSHDASYAAGWAALSTSCIKQWLAAFLMLHCSASCLALPRVDVNVTQFSDKQAVKVGTRLHSAGLSLCCSAIEAMSSFLHPAGMQTAW